MPLTNLSTDEAAAQIARSGRSWAGEFVFNTAAEVTYGFRETAANARPDFEPCTDAQKAAFQLALSLFSDVANINFVPANPAGNTDNATMLFASYIQPGTNIAAYGAMPLDGDVWVNLAYTSASSLPLGSYDLQVILHELGHALGLDHPGEYNGGTGETITYQANAGYAEDSRQYSMMSYFEAFETGAFHYSSVAGALQYASSLLLHDIAALQRFYGANMTTRTGDTVYGFNSTAGLASFDFTINKGPVISIWDAGGTHDVLDTSGYSLNQIIDLHAGAFSDIGGMRKNVAIAEGVTIEDAIGGSADDTMAGNTSANILSGNGGWDTMNGLEGNDMLKGGDGNDKLEGGIGNDAMSGDAGDDTLTDEAGNDILNGGLGDDTMTGGNGSDVYHVDSFGDFVIETNATPGTGGTDTVNSSIDYWLVDNVEKLVLSGTAAIGGTGNVLGNTITGNKAANMLSGYGGNDVICGGLGRDTLGGGDGLDDFDFNSMSETGKTSTTRDRITDFVHLQDDVDLSTIDASTKATGNNAFKFIGTASFHKFAGELKYAQFNYAGSVNDKTIISGDVNGDGLADFTIELTGLKLLSAGDFIL